MGGRIDLVEIASDVEIARVLAVRGGGAPEWGKAKLPSQKTAEYSWEHVGSDYIGWLHFQTLYQHLEATQPDMFD